MSTLTATDYVFEIASQGIAPLVPFEIWEVPLDGGRVIRFFEPLVLTPEPMPPDPDEPSEKEYWIVDMPELNLSSYGETIQELWECVHGCIRFNWTEFACEDDSRLAPRAKRIKEAYLDAAEVVYE